MKPKPIKSVMCSPDLFKPKTKTSVFSVQTGLWVGSITKKKNGQIVASKIGGESRTFTDEESAKSFLRNEKSIEEEKPEIINPNQTSLF